LNPTITCVFSGFLLEANAAVAELDNIITSSRIVISLFFKYS
jgi:hypothetical protein